MSQTDTQTRSHGRHKLLAKAYRQAKSYFDQRLKQNKSLQNVKNISGYLSTFYSQEPLVVLGIMMNHIRHSLLCLIILYVQYLLTEPDRMKSLLHILRDSLVFTAMYEIRYHIIVQHSLLCFQQNSHVSYYFMPTLFSTPVSRTSYSWV